MNWWVKAEKSSYGFKFYGKLYYFSFCGYWKFSISALASLFGIPKGITSAAVALTFFAITAVIKKCKSVIEFKKHDKTVVLVKA